MDLNVSHTAPDHSHIIGNLKSKTMSRRVTVKFVRYYDGKCLKSKGKSITESLTAFRIHKLKNARDKHGFF